ncbi:nitroreductase family protein [Thiobacter aerophilum]|uniref:Nitroreductase family protein n=1 Tax=Thiobacter aerophilum TaxID=3121275 RepID=A0ABV0EBC9_9BURK
MTSNLDIVLGYHARSKHHLQRYAAGPRGLDWATQPDPFRHFIGAPRVELPLLAPGHPATTWAESLKASGLSPRPLGVASVAALLELALGLAAWKAYAGSRWALRCNPSSGNLHPTEGYLVIQDCPGLDDGVYHYLSRDHVLERRAVLEASAPLLPSSCLLVGLSAIAWREAWKYGERAFRYCQHDAGHAAAALRFAAATLGWQARLLEGAADADIAALLGLDRTPDFQDAEGEHPDLVLLVGPGPLPADWPLKPLIEATRDWRGRANRLSPHHAHDWPVIEEVAQATRKPATQAWVWTPPLRPPPAPEGGDVPAARLIRQRRSAQAFDGTTGASLAAFHSMLDLTLPRPDFAPFDALSWAPRVHLVLFVHRVEGLAPGLYVLPRRPEAEAELRTAFSPAFAWQRAEDTPAHLPLYRLHAGDARAAARILSCHQDIAADGAFAVAMLAEFAGPLKAGPWIYRQLHWEAGLIGQVLYLAAEAAGLQGTGIGCFFDDATHELLGLAGTALQDLYHFTVGAALEDSRLQTLPAYAHLRRPAGLP